jgi:hypothetical protein
LGETENRDATLWRLVDANVAQLRDAVSSARIPLLIALTWTFVWAVTLYNNEEYGYPKILMTRWENAALADSCPCADPKTIKRFHHALWLADSTGHSKKDSLAVNRVHVLCREVLKVDLEEIARREIQAWDFAVPGIGARTTVFDLGLVGNIGLLLILLWFYYASRRENHAVRAFVDTASSSDWVPFFRTFDLRATNSRLKPRHYAFAYQAVAQRFVFLTSRRSWTLLLATIGMMLLPLAVSVWNLWTDVRDVSLWQLGELVFARMGLAVALTVILSFLSFNVVRLQLMTSGLLNGWYLASRDVWEALGDGEFDGAPVVSIDPSQQRAWATDRRKR